MAVYPFVGGVSGKPFKNLAREDLKIYRTWIVLTSLGSRFHEHCVFLLNAGTMAFMPCRELSLNCMLMSFGASPFFIFHEWIKMYRSLRLCNERRSSFCKRSQ